MTPELSITVHDSPPDLTSEEIKALADEVVKREQKTFEGLAASDLFDFACAEVDWIVDRVFAADQPTVFGARSKATKTSQLIDLSVALGTGSLWLNQFEVPKQRRVLLITGEANNRAASRRISRACNARGTRLSELGDWLRVEAVEFPQLSSPLDREAIARTVERHSPEVVIIDPLYRGLGSLDTNRMAEMGQAIVEFTKSCQPASLILSHHTTKSAAREYGQPPELEDLSGGGLAESCGNWWLLGRNEKYAYDGQHDLCVSYGGRDEQAGTRRILFDETNWTFTVENFGEYLEARNREATEEKERKRFEQQQKRKNEARAGILRSLANIKTPQSGRQIYGVTRGNRTEFDQALRDLQIDETIVQRPYKDTLGRRQSNGYLLAKYADEYDDTQAEDEDV